VFLKHLVPPSVSCKWEHTNEARRKPNDVCQYSQPCPAQFHGCGLPSPCHMQFATRQLRKPFATSKSVFRIHSMGAGTHQAWERKRQQ